MMQGRGEAWDLRKDPNTDITKQVSRECSQLAELGLVHIVTDHWKFGVRFAKLQSSPSAPSDILRRMHAVHYKS